MYANIYRVTDLRKGQCPIVAVSSFPRSAEPGAYYRNLALGLSFARTLPPSRWEGTALETTFVPGNFQEHLQGSFLILRKVILKILQQIS